MIAQIFIPTAEPAMSTGTQVNEATTEIQTQPVTVETKIRKDLHVFLFFHSLSHNVLFHLKDNLLFHQFFSI